MSFITEVTESMVNSRDSRPTITASERALNGAILAAEISESYEEHLEIFGHFYADDSAWTLELRGVTGASCRVTWCSRRRWRAGRVLSEHHYDHHQIGGPLTFSDLRLSGGETAGNVSTRLAKPQ